MPGGDLSGKNFIHGEDFTTDNRGLGDNRLSGNPTGVWFGNDGNISDNGDNLATSAEYPLGTKT